jgi:hypothetical protein
MIEMAWAAGFFDGEGSTFVLRHKQSRGGTGRLYPCVSVGISVCQTDRRPLDRFVAALGLGKVRGPYRPRGNQRPYFRWERAGRPSVHRALVRLWPYLSDPKKEQARRVWAELLSLRGKKSPRLPKLPEAE